MPQISMTYVKRIHVLGKIVGIMLMLYGGASVIFGFLSTLVFILPGIITLFLGVLLFRIGQEAKKVLRTDDQLIYGVHRIFHTYSLYLMILGILAIITILFYIGFYIVVLPTDG